MSRALDGTNPVAYLGVRPLTPPNMIIPGLRPTSQPRDPTQNDIQYNLGDHWLNTSNQRLWYLAALGSQNIGGINTRFATWLRFGFGDGTVKTLTGDVGGAVGPDAAGNINTLGTAGHVVVTGVPGTFTLSWDIDGSIADSYPTDLGTAIPALNVLNIITDNAGVEAGASVLFTGVGNTVQLHVTDADSNTLIGENSGNLTLSGAGNTGLGGGSLFSLTTGDANTAVGLNSLQVLTTGDNNTAVGDLSLSLLVSGNNNIGLGLSAGQSYTGAESSNIAIGNIGTVAESNKIRIGTDGSGVGQQNQTFMSGDVLMPHNLLLTASTGSAATNPTIVFGASNNLISFFLNSVFLGQSAGNTTGTGIFNIGIGPLSMDAYTTGSQNTAIGNDTLGALTTGTNNNAYGYLSSSAITTGSDNTGIGTQTLIVLTTGGSNTAVGDDALNEIVTGSFNTAIGSDAGGSLTTSDSSNICINNPGTVGDNNTLRIGAGAGAGSRQLNRAFIHGIRGITTGVNDAVAVLIDSAGQLGTTSSSSRYKENIEDMGAYSEDILRLRPVIFDFKNRPSERKCVGLIAEEVGEIMPDLVAFDAEGLPQTVRYQDLVPLMLNEIQKLKSEIDTLKKLLM